MTSTTKILAIGLLFQNSTSCAAKLDLTQYQLSHQKKEISVENAPRLDVRWGITQDMVLNATINPDFSQVESDAGN